MLTNTPFTIDALHSLYRQGIKPDEVIAESLKRLSDIGDKGIYLYVSNTFQLSTSLTELGPFDLDVKPLWGIPFAVKDNIDVAGMPTTAACAEFSYIAQEDAYVVSLLKKAGAIVIGKTNLDQFATGLVGLRTPFPAPKNAIDDKLVPGGSSSGSAVAVSHHQVSFSLGTDTAGSGRIPAALNNIIGLKPSLGSISSRGVIPACRTLDTVSIFALTVKDAAQVYKCCHHHDPQDSFAKPYLGSATQNIPTNLTIAIPDAHSLILDEPEQKKAYKEAVKYWKNTGATLVEVNFEPFYEVAKLLYEGPWVAERYAALASFIKKHPDALYPVTKKIIESAHNFSASDAFNARYKLQDLAKETSNILEGIDVICVPSMPGLVYKSDVKSDPWGPNNRLGTYTNFVNLLNLCAISVPGKTRVDGYPSSITLIARDQQDALIHALATDYHQNQSRYLGSTKHENPTPIASIANNIAERINADEIAIAVVGAHMKDLPLNYQLTDRDARFLISAKTAQEYRLYKLGDDEEPLRPGLIRSKNGESIELEIWALPINKMGDFINQIPSPLSVGTITLSNQQQVKGFLCEYHALESSQDITQFGGWRKFFQSENL
jgi:allophanate hydrolase